MELQEAMRSGDDTTTNGIYVNMTLNNKEATNIYDDYEKLEVRGGKNKGKSTPNQVQTDYKAELRRLMLIVAILAILLIITTITTFSILIAQIVDMRKEARATSSDINSLKHVSSAIQETNKMLHDELKHHSTIIEESNKKLEDELMHATSIIEESNRTLTDGLKHVSSVVQENNKSIHDKIEALHGSVNRNKADINKVISDITPVHGGWGSWKYISECSLSCGGGQRLRKRMCSSPSPSFGGEWCSGNDTEVLSCNTETCPDLRSAFTVSAPRDGPKSGTIRFTNVITNIGSHYNTSSGQFVCMYPGTYVFSLHIYKSHTDVYAYCYIRRNGSYRIKVYAKAIDDNGHYASSNTVVLYLSAGEIVDLGGCTNFTTMLYHMYYTSFSGFLLKAD